MPIATLTGRTPEQLNERPIGVLVVHDDESLLHGALSKCTANVTGDTKIAPTGGSSGDTIRRYQFFVLSDSIDWVQSSLGLSAIGAVLKSASVDVEVTFSVNNTAAVDLILMTMCDVVIMTTGTYGWWGAWLANASKTIYFRNWPRPRSSLAKLIVREDFFPPNWISFDGPFYDKF